MDGTGLVAPLFISCTGWCSSWKRDERVAGNHRVPELQRLLDPETSFPADPFATGAALAALRQLGLQSCVLPATVLDSARAIECLASVDEEAAVARCAFVGLPGVVNPLFLEPDFPSLTVGGALFVSADLGADEHTLGLSVLGPRCCWRIWKWRRSGWAVGAAPAGATSTSCCPGCLGCCGRTRRRRCRCMADRGMQTGRRMFRQGWPSGWQTRGRRRMGGLAGGWTRFDD
jgi:hypothetical protein